MPKMLGLLVACLVPCLVLLAGIASAEPLQSDVIPTSMGDLKITFLGHGSLQFEVAGTIVQIDPYSKVADYAALPKADLVLVTHEHQDHLDPQALDKTLKPGTEIVLNEAAGKKFGRGAVLKNGETRTVLGISITAVPAYNLVHKRDSGEPFHPKGSGNGYVLGFGGTRVYIAGDTENVPEMRDLAGVDLAFLPVNLPYTMTPEMLADAAGMVRPKVLYPYHTGDTDMGKVKAALAGLPGVEVRIRNMR
jgi:L-ascorbate metabolism protein UlaG (beta-lactamase superfamily)